MMWQIAGTAALALSVLALAAVVWWLLRRDRLRSHARIVALATAIDSPGWTPQTPTRNDAMPLHQMTLAPAPDVRLGTTFAAFAAGGLLVVLTAILLLIVVRQGDRPQTSKEARVPRSGAVELLSMRHTRDGDTLIVSGLVRNASEFPTPGLTVVVSALDNAGRVAARGQSRLDPFALEPGKETSFRVTVSHSSDLGRYRLAIVDGSQIVPHVDRRADLARRAMATD